MGYSKHPHIKTHDFGVQDDLVLRDRSLVIARGGGARILRGITRFSEKRKEASSVIDRHKGGDQNKKNGISGGGGISMNI